MRRTLVLAHWLSRAISKANMFARCFSELRLPRRFGTKGISAWCRRDRVGPDVHGHTHSRISGIGECELRDPFATRRVLRPLRSPGAVADAALPPLRSGSRPTAQPDTRS